MSIRKLIRYIIILIILCPIIIWLLSLIKCEVLTLLYGQEFESIYRENTMMGEIDYLKVLEYSDVEARVYYVSAHKSGGDILKFSKNEEQWCYDSWEKTVWSSTGSASDVIWPYWWHFLYGGI